MTYNKLTRPLFLFRNNWISDILILGGFLFIFYVFWLGGHSLFNPDEGRYPEVAREMLATKDFITPRVNGVAFLDKPVLYYWLQAIAITLFGINEWAVRFFPMLFGLLGCLMTYFTARKLYDRRTGWISTIVLATTPLYFGAAHYANLDLEVAVLITCSLYSFLNAIQNSPIDSRWLIAFYIFAALAFLTKGMIGIVFPIMIISVWLYITKKYDLIFKMQLLVGILIVSIISIPWYLLVQKENPTFFHYFFITQQITRFLSTANFNNKTPFWFYFPIVIFGFFPWILFLLQTISVSFKRWFLDIKLFKFELFFVIWFISIFVFFSIPKSKTIGYILPIFPALAMIVGRYVSLHWFTTYRFTFKNPLFLYPMSASFIAIFLLLFNHFKIDINPNAGYFLTSCAVILIASAIISFCCFMRNTLSYFFISCVLTNTLVLFLSLKNAEYFNLTTSKPLVLTLKKMIKPSDEVVTYFKYYQDLPIYLNDKHRRITIVADWDADDIESHDNWRRELWYGMPFQNTDQWLIDEDEFWNRWQSNKRIFTFVNINYLKQFKKRAKFYFWIGQYQDIILLSNKINLYPSRRGKPHFVA